MWNLAVGYRVAPSWKVSGKISNLLDKEYQTSVGYPADERAYYVTVDYALDPVVRIRKNQGPCHWRGLF